MLRAWRIVKARHSKTAFDGEGARIHGGRWNSPGVPMVYLADSRSLALLEILVHVGSEELLPSYVLFEVAYDEHHMKSAEESELPRGWSGHPPPASLREIGDRWCRSAASVLLSVPSSIVPKERNLLMNPLHPDARKLRVKGPERVAIDPRLTRERRSQR